MSIKRKNLVLFKVVPRSSQLVTSDNENALVTVTLFRKVADEFKHHARDHKYLMLIFSYYNLTTLLNFLRYI